MKLPPDYTPVDDLFTRPRLSRFRSTRLLPAPEKINGVRCYSKAVIEKFNSDWQLGQDRWMMEDHGPGRPAVAEIARLALGGR